jgi:ketosteroid isomerase-like protein
MEVHRMTEQKASLDFEAMRRAIEQLDADLLISLYADDAELRIVNRYTTPSSPRELQGNEEIAEYLRDVCGRAMTHRVENEVVGEDRVAFNEACEYPDGTRVLCAATLEVRDGKIHRQVNVEAWDE